MKKNYLVITSFFILLLLGAIPTAGARSHSAERLLEETDKLLESVEKSIQKDLSREERKVIEESREDAAGNALLEAKFAEERHTIEAERKKLLQQINEWSRDNIYLEQLTALELNDAMARARAIADYYGLDVEKLGKLFELGKKTIKKSAFVVPDRIPPDKDESYSRYFRDFFIYAHEREKELAEFREKNQAYRVGLFKRVTLAYMRALLSSGERPPTCVPGEDSLKIRIGDRQIETFGCPDPVVDELRRYVKAVQLIASAESDTFAAEAEMVIASQVVINDFVSIVPLLNTAVDIYSLYSGENLAGECLSRFSYGLTTVFTLIEFIPTSWVEQAVKRIPGLEKQIGRLMAWATVTAEWSGAMIQGFAYRMGVSPAQMEIAMKVLTSEINFTKVGIELKPGNAGKISKSTRQLLNKELDMNGTVIRNSEMAMEGQVLMRNLSPELRAKMERKSAQILESGLESLPANAKAAAGDFSEVIDASNMVPEHLEAFNKVARDEDAIVIFRSVNPDAADRIAQNYPTKWMDVKGKSADWGPQRAFIPVDQKFSKLGNPGKVMDDEALTKVAKFYDKVQNCLYPSKGTPKCFKVDLVLADGSSVHVWKKGDVEIPVLRNSAGDFVDTDTGRLLDISEGSISPMEVLAGHNEAGELVPLTADYDLMAVGKRTDVTTPKASSTEGFITEEERQVNDRLNQAAKDAGYTGGNVVHHGPENQYFASPGALANDPEITVIDPDLGKRIIPRCDFDCMRQWCRESGQCGGLPICEPGSATPPCLFVDPDRLFKDYMHNARLRGYTNLRPNAKWRWGDVNGLSGWTPLVVLDSSSLKPGKWRFGQYRAGEGVVDTINKVGLRRDAGIGVRGARDNIEKKQRQAGAMDQAASRAMQYLFTCPEEQR